jgi:hypothetical protein
MKPISLPNVSESGSRTKPLHLNGSLGTLSRSVSQGGNLEAIPERNVDGWDPDELFIKHTVAEVKVVQKRLRYLIHFVHMCCACNKTKFLKEGTQMQSRKNYVSWLGT